MLDNAKFVDKDADSEERKTWGTEIYVGGKYYATSLFWQPLQNQEEPLNEIIEASEGILEGADLFCLRPGKAPQFGICVSQEGYKSGTTVGAVAVSTALADRSSFIAVFKVPNGWWYICVRNDIILSDGDMLFLQESDARNQFMSMLAVPDWGRKIAPKEWNIEDAEEISLEDLLQRGMQSKLQKIKGLRGAKLLMVLGGGAIVGFWLLSNLIDALFFTPVKRPKIIPVKPKIIKKVEEAPIIKPWETLKNPIPIMVQCTNGVKNLQKIFTPGWKIGAFSCSQTGISTSWTREFGRMAWMQKSLDVSKIKLSYHAFSEDGNTVSGGINFENVNTISSPPMKTLMGLRHTLNNFFQSIGQTANLSNGSFTESYPRSDGTQKKVIYRYVGFNFSSTYNPLVWSKKLTKFSGLEIKNINYDGQNWVYEGIIYAL